MSKDLWKRLEELSPAKRELLALRARKAPPERPSRIPRREAKGPIPLSFAQQRMWFLDRLEPGNAFYNEPLLAARLEGRLDAAVLARCLDRIVLRHEILRTTFGSVDGQPVQVVADAGGMPLEIVDLRGVLDREAQALTRAAEEAKRLFDLAAGPLIHATLVRLEDEAQLLLVSRHHIVSDARSTRILIHELSSLYAAAVQGVPDPLPPLPIQYGDYARWQREEMEAILERQLEHWRTRLAGELPVVELPLDRPRPRTQAFRGHHLSRPLGPALTAEIKAFSQAEGVTPFMTLLAAFKAWLHRYTAQTDLVVGTPIAGRSRTELEHLIGFFANTLALRTEIVADLTFREAVARVRTTALDAFGNQELPFERLVDALQPKRDLSRNPIIQIMFVLQEAAEELKPLPGLGLTPLEVESGTSKFDLTLSITEKQGSYETLFEYNVDLFDAATAERMLGHLHTLIEGAIRRPERRVGELPLLGPDGEAQAVVAWNATSAAFPERCLHELIEAQVDRDPGALAVIFEDQRVSYGELDQRATRLARDLYRRGVRVGDVVGLCLERSDDMVVAIVAILKAGAAYLPLDPVYPAERLAFMVEDARPRLIVTRERLAGRLPGTAPQVWLDRDAGAIAAEPVARLASPVTPWHLAYVIYTSGSTGTPKGVMVDHRGRANNFCDFNRRFGVGPGDRLLAVASMSFDMCAYDVLGTLAAGAAVVVSPSGNERDPASWARLAAAHRVTIWHSVPAMLEMLVEYAGTNAQADRPAALRLALLGGDWIPLALPDRLRAIAPGVRFISLGGATELSMDSTIYDVEDVHPGWASIPYGRPMANQTAYVLDAALQLVPPGVSGELHLGGVGIAWGYLDRPALTAERFIPHPFGRAGERLYKTGDLARYGTDGVLELLGRLDNQVKINGARIEIGEIEAALKRHPSVGDAVVVARADGGSAKRLVGYVVPAASAGDLDLRTLRDWLRERMPEFMVPSAFVTLDALPLSPNGKVKRKGLPAPSDMAPARDVVAPRTEAERALVEACRKVLGVQTVSVEDNFFSLGGDSIRSIQVIAAVAEAGFRVTPKQIFEFQTLAELAAVVEQTAGAAKPAALVHGPVPLTPLQDWLFRHDIPDRNHFNQAVRLELARRVDSQLLERALQVVVEHHPALRLRFRADGTRWLQEPAAVEDARLLTVRRIGGDAGDADFEAAAGALQRSLDLERGPVVRALLVEPAPGAAGYLVVAAHRLVIDGASWPILLEDLAAAYAALERGEPPRLRPAGDSFVAWVARLTGHARSAQLRDELPYWAAERRRSVRPLPVDLVDGRNGEANDEASERRVWRELDRHETAELVDELPRRLGVATSDLVTAALAFATARWIGAPRVGFHLDGHGRVDPEDQLDISGTIGCFTCRYPIVVDVGETPADALAAVRAELRAVPAGGIGWGLLRRLADPQTVARLAELPEPELTIKFIGRTGGRTGDLTGAPGAEAPLFAPSTGATGPIHDPRGRRSHVLKVDWTIEGDHVRLAFAYSAALHTPATIERLADDVRDALRALARAVPATRVERHALTPRQRHMLHQAIHAPSPGLYVNQSSYTLTQMDVGAFRRAWEHLVARHPPLRTSFEWDGPEPRQIVHPRVELAIDEHDWRGVPVAEQVRRFHDLLHAERLRGFDLGRAPLFRLAVVRLADDLVQYLKVDHYLLLDAWSGVLLRKELLATYTRLVMGQAPDLPPCRPFADHLAWLSRHDLQAGRDFFVRSFAGHTPALLCAQGEVHDAAPRPIYAKLSHRLPEATSQTLAALARERRLTLGTLVQGAWALVVARTTGQDDVAFGVTSSGRSPEIPGVDTIVGLLINIIPVRMNLSGTGLIPALQAFQRRQGEARQYEHAALDDVARWAGVARPVDLFDSILVFANYPVDATIRAFADRGGAEHPLATVDHGLAQTEFPVRVDVEPGNALSLAVSYHRGRVTDRDAERLLARFAGILEDLARRPDAPIRALGEG